MATDPVCGMTVDPAKAGATVAHGGKTYYFCCKHCAAKFQAEPQKYLQPAIDPVCGMKVEPANAAAEIEHAGRRYFFCSKQCATRFQADPAKYAAKARPAETPAENAERNRTLLLTARGVLSELGKFKAGRK